MKSIKDFLGRYGNMIPVETQVRDSVVEFAKRVGIELDRENISYVNRVVRIQCSNTEKMALLLKKEELLREFEVKLGKKAPREIK